MFCRVYDYHCTLTEEFQLVESLDIWSWNAYSSAPSSHAQYHCAHNSPLSCITLMILWRLKDFVWLSWILLIMSSWYPRRSKTWSLVEIYTPLCRGLSPYFTAETMYLETFALQIFLCVPQTELRTRLVRDWRRGHLSPDIREVLDLCTLTRTTNYLHAL